MAAGEARSPGPMEERMSISEIRTRGPHLAGAALPRTVGLPARTPARA